MIPVDCSTSWKQYYTGIDKHYDYYCIILHIDAFLLEEKQNFLQDPYNLAKVMYLQDGCADTSTV